MSRENPSGLQPQGSTLVHTTLGSGPQHQQWKTPTATKTAFSLKQITWWEMQCFLPYHRVFPTLSVDKDVTAIGEPSPPTWARRALGKEKNAGHQAAATPDGEPKGSSGCENTRHWTSRAVMHVKGMIPGSPDSCIFPHMEKLWIP